MSRPHLLVFDQAVAANSPAGSCVLAEIAGVLDTYHVTLFSDRCDPRVRDRVEWLRVPLPKRPILLRYVLFQLLAPLRFGHWRLKGRQADLIQTTQGQFIGAQIAYAHFCHRAYLKGPWKGLPVKGLRRLARWINHSFNALTEQRAFQRAKTIVVPSQGLKRELEQEYPDCASRIAVIPNPVDVERFARPADFDRLAFRAERQIPADNVVFAFMALGDFARKGLGLVIDALSDLPEAEKQRATLLVIGGRDREIREYEAIAEQRGVRDRCVFVGMQSDVRPFLWGADVFAFPSAYEIFSLAILQAAAAGLPPIVSQGLYGAEEFVDTATNGWLVERTAQGVGEALRDALLDADRLQRKSTAAALSARTYSEVAFAQRWRSLLETART